MSQNTIEWIKALVSLQVVVMAWLARGYFIPGGTSQRGDVQAPAFRVTHCRTWIHVDIRLGSVGSRQDSSGSHRDL